MSIVNIISAVGNNASIYPLIVRDCGIEVPVKLGMTYNQNIKDSKQAANNAFREKFIDEYITSAVWLGGIPLINNLYDKYIKSKELNPNVSTKLLFGDKKQNLENNIKKFKSIAKEEVKDLEKILKNKKQYQKLLAYKLILSTGIPIFLMGYILPKLNFALTNKILKKQEKAKIQKGNEESQNNVNFKGLFSTLANTSTLEKMVITDGGLTVGRVATGRNKYEKMENGFRMTAMMFLNFVAPIYLEKILNKLSKLYYKDYLNLDPKLLSDKELIKSLKDLDINVKEKRVLNFVDNASDPKTQQILNKYCGVKYLKSGIRDPRVYVEEANVEKFLKELNKLKTLINNSKNPNKIIKKLQTIKCTNIILNVGISSFLLACALPKLIFILRKKITGSEIEPGLRNIVKS